MAKKDVKKYQISFVNKGKPFELGKWTVKKQKEVLKYVSDLEAKNPKMSEEEKDVFFQDKLILIGLSDVDAEVTQEMIDEMHPQDKKALFTAIYFSGREGITVSDKKDSGNFRK